MPEQISRYEVKRELGRGGMATVYLAFDPRFRRDVAIKVLPPQFTHDPRFLERFEHEAQTIASLEDPAIVPVYDYGEFQSTPFLVMRYMEGGSLRSRLTGKPLPLSETNRIMRRIAPALDEAHRSGIIHRDLKPDNVLFDRRDRPYLADFGIARMAEATHTMTIVGTPAYMSPEQVKGDQKLDGRADIYALGTMLYEMMVGGQPYIADTPTKQMMMHVLEPVPDVLAAKPDLPEQTQLVIEKVMAKDREKRYRTAGELATAVEMLASPPRPKALPPVRETDVTVVESVPTPPPPVVKVKPAPEKKEPPKPEEKQPVPPSLYQYKSIPKKPQPEIREKVKYVKGDSYIPAWVYIAGVILIILLAASWLTPNPEPEVVIEMVEVTRVVTETEVVEVEVEVPVYIEVTRIVEVEVPVQ